MLDCGSIALLAFDENAIQAMLHPARSLFSTATRYLAFSRLSILSFESAIMPKRSTVSFEQGFRTCRDIDEEKPLHEKVLFLSVHTLQYFHSASSHSSSDMLCGSSGFRARYQSLHSLHQSGNMPRPAPMGSDVEDGSPTTASKEFEAVCFKRSWWGVLVSGFYLLPAAAAISVATFWCLLFSVSVGTNKRSRALSMP